MRTITPPYLKKIPVDAGHIQGWRDIPIRDVGISDPLVPLGPLSEEGSVLTTSSIYFGEHSNSPYIGDNRLQGSLLTLFARRSIVRRLIAAQQLLPPGHHLLLLDAYRPYQVQKSLHDFYKHKLSEKHPDMEQGALDYETQKYVSLPSTDSTMPSPHSTGGVVDVAIIKLDQIHEKHLVHIRSQLADRKLDFAKRVGLEMRLSALMRHYGKMLEFGTAFDHGGEMSALAYYEAKIAAGETLTDKDTEACTNRRLLFTVMTEAGFQPYFAEWWHFDAPESQWGAASEGRKLATFGAAMLDEANKAHEDTRLHVHNEILKTQNLGDKAVPQTTLQTEIVAAIRKTGDPYRAEHWPTEIIAPPKE